MWERWATPRDQLAWAIRLAKPGPPAVTEDDWWDLRQDLVRFAEARPVFGQAGYEIFAGRKAVGVRREWASTPSQDEAEQTLTAFQEIFTAVIRRQRADLGKIETRPALLWAKDVNRFVLKESGAGIVDRAVLVLARLLEEFGHLVKECPAPAPRGTRKACGTWFVASRPNQTYCSARCQSRATTRASRERSRGKRARQTKR